MKRSGPSDVRAAASAGLGKLDADHTFCLKYSVADARQDVLSGLKRSSPMRAVVPDVRHDAVELREQRRAARRTRLGEHELQPREPLEDPAEDRYTNGRCE